MARGQGASRHRSQRWLGIGLLTVTIWGSAPVIPVTGAPDAATPGVATPALPSSYTYRSDQPVIVISSGPATATLLVARLPTDRYGVVTVATDGDAAFRFTITPPRGGPRTIFETNAPDALTAALLLDETGDYILAIEAAESWVVTIR